MVVYLARTIRGGLNSVAPIVAKEEKMVKKQILTCSASSYQWRPCPYNGAPTTKCKASLPYKDGTCLFYHPDRLRVTGGMVK
jgi:hypothetical protein